MEKTLSFIGGGNMGGAILRAACRALPPEQVLLYDPDAEKAEALSAETGCALAPSGEAAVRSAKYVMLCVKPQIFAGVLSGLLPALKEGLAAGEDRTVVSIAAGVTLSAIETLLGGAQVPLVRIMPNTPAAIGKGTLLVAAGRGAAGERLEGLMQALAPCGLLVPVTEAQLDRGTAVSGCGPAYVCLFIEALADGGVEIGLPRAMAQELAAQTVLGAAAMVLESGQHPGALKDAVCSPGGSTIAGVAELEKRGFRAAAAQAVVRAWSRNQQLGQ